MLSLNSKKYTGEIVNILDKDGIIVSNSQYINDEKEYDWHFHTNPHIAFVFQGKHSENSNYKKKESVSGISFYHSGETHFWKPISPVAKTANVEFDSSFMKKYEFTEARISDAVNSNLSAIFLLLKIQNEMLMNGENSSLTIQTLLLELLSESSNASRNDFPKWVLVLYDLLNDRWNEQITLAELALATDVHPTTVSKYFRKYFSCTLGEYLRQLKIKKSIPLITNNKLQLTEIAFQCGFADQSHFTRTFKQMTGFLPRDFRKI